MNLNKASIYTLCGMFIKLGSLLLINKLMARYLSLNEYGAFGQYQSIFQVIITVATFGMSTGVTKLISKYFNNDRKRNLVVSEIKRIITISSVLLIIIISFKFKEIFSITTEYIENEYLIYVILLTVVAIPIATLSNISTAIYVGRLYIKENTLANSFASMLALLIAYPLISSYSLVGAIVVFIVYTTCPLIYTFKNTRLFDIKLEKRLNRSRIILKTLFGFSLAAIISTLATPIFQIYARYQLNELNMNESIGIWQGILKISDITILVPVAILGNYLLPKIASIKKEVLILDELKNTLIKIIPLYGVWLILIILFKDLIVIKLFNINYIQIVDGLNYQLFGDFIRLPILMIAIIFLARGKIIKFICLELCSPTIQIILFSLDGKEINVDKMTLNYLISFVITGIILSGYIFYCESKKIRWN